MHGACTRALLLVLPTPTLDHEVDSAFGQKQRPAELLVRIRLKLGEGVSRDDSIQAAAAAAIG
jgi:hypothetical protein